MLLAEDISVQLLHWNWERNMAAVNFPNSPVDGDTHIANGVTYTYNATKTVWRAAAAGSSSVSTVADMAALIAKTGMTDGDQVFVQANNNLYIYSGTGWYKVATVQNDSPSAITGVDGTYSLAIDGTPTVITGVSTDPEGFPLTWSYSTSGLGSIATVSQANNVFTVTPSTDSANVGTFTLTINATDGVNGAVSANTSITLQFQILNSNYTTLLATSVDTSDNNNITDSSTNNQTITVTGDAHAGTFSPYRHGGYSTYFDGTGDHLTASHASDFNFGSGDFTAEAWFNVPDTSGTDPFITTSAGQGVTGADFQGFWLGLYQGQYYFIASSDGSNWDIVIQAGTPQANTWTHICVVRSGNTFTLYVNGVSIGTATNSGTLTNSNNLIAVGGRTRNSQYSIGYLRDVRVIKGSAVIPDVGGPISPLTAVTNTTLLTCHLPYIADGSSSAHSITVNGNTSTKPFTPYDNLEYAATDHGGSVYFDGNADYLTIPASDDFRQDQGDWTIDGWFYLKSFASTTCTLSLGSHQGIDNFTTYITNAGSVGYEAGNGTSWAALANYNSPTNLVSLNTWNHIAWVRSSGSLFIYLNGTRILNQASATFGVGTSGNLYIGNYFGQATTNAQPHYQSDLRIIKGTALYTGDSFSVPTAPLSSSGTSLHLKGTDASIIDKSQNANLQLIGNTTGSTTQVKFANTKSMSFDGAGDYIKPNDVILPLTQGVDYTIEGWFYADTITGVHPMVSQYVSGNGGRFSILVEQSVLKFFEGGSIGQTISVNTGTWYHFLMCRSGTTHYAFMDGTLVGSSWTSSTNIVNTPTLIGHFATPTNYYFDGFLQDIRITKGLARYTANFTPPTEPLKG